MRNKTAVMMDHSVTGAHRLFSTLSVKHILLYPTFISSELHLKKKNHIKDTLSTCRQNLLIPKI